MYPILPEQVACTDCGLVHRYQLVAPKRVASCRRCGAVLYRHRPQMFDIALALTVASLILFILTNSFPLLGLKTRGLVQEITLWQASIVFWQRDYPILSVLLSLNVIILPLFELVALLWVLLAAQRPQYSPTAVYLFRWLRELKPWGMLEVFMLGLLVAIVKLGDLATLLIGPAFWSFAFLIITMAVTSATLDPFTVWLHLKPCSPAKAVA